MYYSIIIAIVIIFCILWFVSKNKKYAPDISQTYSSEAGEFQIEGRKDRFVIRKNNSVEFLVEDGRITAVKNLKKGSDFIYYKDGDSNGTN